MVKHCEFCGKAIDGFSRSTKKYCSDNCKQLAFYSRQGMMWGKPAETIPFNVKPDFTLNGKPDEQDEILPPMSSDPPQNKTAEEKVRVKQDAETPVAAKPVAEQLIVKQEPKQPYKWISSRLLESIEQYRQTSNTEMMFADPRYYWTESGVEIARWVSIRFRCLLENIIRLSNRRIDRRTLREISAAFNALVVSETFLKLPDNYPFFMLIADMRNRFLDLVENIGGDEITLRLSVDRKAELMAARFMMSSFVPRKSFSQMNFSDKKPKESEKEKQEDEDDSEDDESGEE